MTFKTLYISETSLDLCLIIILLFSYGEGYYKKKTAEYRKHIERKIIVHISLDKERPVYF